ncbi:MAG: energy-coupling factor ABC transporter substrate-binding protein [Firmicutes bacterium]|nr:energy-coupling factor ABC transporter substrate-binding protein [Bacillota bacterium]
MLSRKQQIGIVLAILIICLSPFWLADTADKEEAFTGADGQAETLVQEITPDYEPWFSSIWEPPSGEIESLLFALQAAIGAGFLGYYLGYHRRKSKGGA